MAGVGVLRLFLIVVVAGLLLPSGVVSHLSSKLSAGRLASVLDPVQLCLVASSRGNSSSSYQAVHRACLGRLGLGAAVHEHAFLRLNQSAFPRYESKRSHCCIDDLPLAERQLDEAVAEEFDSVPADVALRLLQALSLRNMSLVLAGDSMNAQLHSALLHEIRRQGQVLRRFEFSARLLSLGASRKTTTHGYHRWDPPRGQGEGVTSNPVFIYVLDMWYGHQRSAQEQDLCLRFLPALLADHRPTGVLLLANIGLHLEVERNAFVRQGTTEPMVQSIGDFFAWLRHLASRHPSSIVAFRESTPTHFPSPDGSYEAWHHRAPAEKNSLAPGYRCRPSSNISSLENRVAAEIIASMPANESFPRLGLLRVHDVLAPFHAMHYGNCAHAGRIPTLDCVHYCAFLPQMFLPIWHSLWRLVSDAPTAPRRHPFNAPVLPSLPPYTTLGTLFRRASDNALVVCYNGICRVAASLQAVADELGMVFSPADIRPAAAGALLQPFGRPIPATPPHPEGTVVRLHLSKQLFLVVANGTRRALPSWEAYQALPGRSARAGVVTLPLHALLRLAEGPPMPEPTTHP